MLGSSTPRCAPDALWALAAKSVGLDLANYGQILSSDAARSGATCSSAIPWWGWEQRLLTLAAGPSLRLRPASGAAACSGKRWMGPAWWSAALPPSVLLLLALRSWRRHSDLANTSAGRFCLPLSGFRFPLAVLLLEAPLPGIAERELRRERLRLEWLWPLAASALILVRHCSPGRWRARPRARVSVSVLE